MFPVIWLSDRLTRAPYPSHTSVTEWLPRLAFAFLTTSLLVWGLRGGLRDVGKVAIWIMTFYFGFYYCSDVRRARHYWVAWLSIAIAAALLLLLSPSKWGEKVFDIFAWEHRTTFAYFLAVPTIVLLFRALAAPTLKALWLAIPLCILLPALILSYSRGAWLVVAAALGMMLFLARQRRLALIYAFAGALSVIWFVADSDAEVALLVRSLYDWNIRSSALYRLDVYFAGAAASAETGLWGTGPSSVGAMLANYTLQTYEHLDDEKFATDSDVVWLLVEAGLVGFVGLLLTLVAYSSRILRMRDSLQIGSLASFVAATFCAFLGWIAFDNVLMTPLGWFLLGSMWGIINSMRQPDSAYAPGK
jgi:hypothetical protein